MKNNNEIYVVALSGGVDSTALALDLKRQGKIVRGIFLNVGQYSAPRQEMAVKKLSILHNIPVEIVDLTGLSNLFNTTIAPPYRLVLEGDTEEARAASGSKGSTMIMASYAHSIGAKALYHAATIEDSEDFKKAIPLIEEAIKIGGRPEFEIRMPFAKKTRSEVLSIMYNIDDTLETWSCLWGNANQCGKCECCETRKQRFDEAGIPDITKYEQEHFLV